MIVIILSIMIPKLDIVRNIRKIRYNESHHLKERQLQEL